MDDILVPQEISPAQETDHEAVDCASLGQQAHDAAPLSPTLQELFAQSDAEASKLLQLIWRLSDLIPGRSSKFWYGHALSEVRYTRQLHPDLPPALGSGSHVFAVTAPHSGFPVSLRHWSVYSQGHFYHLSAPAVRNLKPTEQSGPSGFGSMKKDIDSTLKDQDFLQGTDPEVLKAKSSKEAFIAFEVGQTQYPPSEIKKRGQEVVDKLPKYDLLEANCQIFTQGVLDRIVMTRRDCSVFAGTLSQLVAWDLEGRLDPDGPLPNSRASGFLIRKPTQPTSVSMSSTYPFHYFAAADMSKARAIRTLYGKGKGHLAPGARDPTGEHNALGYGWVLLKGDLRGCGRDLKRAGKEFGEDIAARKWGDAFRGREEYRQERIKCLEEDFKNGKKFTGMEKAILEFFSRPRPGGDYLRVLSVLLHDF